jgi:hypothetical protein
MVGFEVSTEAKEAGGELIYVKAVAVGIGIGLLADVLWAMGAL